jgi:hypothetical protein
VEGSLGMARPSVVLVGELLAVANALHHSLCASFGGLPTPYLTLFSGKPCRGIFEAFCYSSERLSRWWVCKDQKGR